MPQAAAILSATTEPKIRVMVVDDAVVFRGLVSRWMQDEPDIEIVSAHRNGQEALENFSRYDPDLVVLDIEMPVLDGLETLPRLLAKKPDLTVIISSTVTRRNAEVGIRALSLGAADYVSKPETNREMTMSPEFRRELIARIRALGRRRFERIAQAVRPQRFIAESAEPVSTPELPYRLRPFSAVPPRVLVIGSSTGGPQALQIMLRGIAPAIARVPVLITQHMPPTFTTILAEHIGRATGRPAHEGQNGELLAPGRLYIAPGARHMLIARDGEQARIVVNDDPPVHFCRPSVDPLFATAAAAFGSATLAVILTGMGSDGTDGASIVAEAGGSVIAQDEATSVIWGMPGSAAEAGVCAGILPLEAIASRINELVTGGRA
ncbi:MAG TPA: chemotaxis response regulator protein-glutamate methylesterase [Xanthobacteraceae bacterium]|nr:chemotaxis response regulator protein-glutamate methylesterase [Xanthobacteraceae bacterium]